MKIPIVLIGHRLQPAQTSAFRFPQMIIANENIKKLPEISDRERNGVGVGVGDR